MKTEFTEKGLIIKAENATEAYALNALALDLQSRAISMEWVVFDMKFDPPFKVQWQEGCRPIPPQIPEGGRFVGQAGDEAFRNWCHGNQKP